MVKGMQRCSRAQLMEALRVANKYSSLASGDRPLSINYSALARLTGYSSSYLGRQYRLYFTGLGPAEQYEQKEQAHQRREQRPARLSLSSISESEKDLITSAAVLRQHASKSLDERARLAESILQRPCYQWPPTCSSSPGPVPKQSAVIPTTRVTSSS